MRCTECEELELARVRDELPVQVMPVPHAALDGFPAGRRPRDLTRRRLLQGGMAGLASIYAPKALGWESVWESVAEAATGQNCLVMIYLAGGNDGLNTLVPAGGADYSSYVAKRPVLSRGQGATSGGRVGSQPLAGAGGAQLAFSNVVVSTGGGGDNGDASFGFDVLYGDGSGGAGSNLAVLPAVDVPNYSLSHFDNSDVWFSGSTSASTTGWLGRWIDRNGSATNPLQAISIDNALSKAIRTQVNPVCAIPSLSALGFTMNASGGYASPSGDASHVDINARMRELSAFPPGDPANLPLARSRGTFGIAVDAYQAGKALGPLPAPVGYPANATSSSSLSGKLRLAAHLLGANLGTRVITIHWGGFDTHGGQLAAQDPQLTELSRALGAFQADLATRGIEQNVSTMVFSEFGRRVAENGSAGTDHGAGGLMMVAGSGVRGGLASQWPGCTDANLLKGNLAIPTNFRSVYGSIVGEWLGDDPQAVLGAAAIPPLVRGDGLSGTKVLFR